MLVSIIIPVFNQRERLEVTLDYFAKQSYDDIEIVIVDDGSEPAVDSWIADFLLGKKRLNYKVIRNQNNGRAVSRNLGVDNSCGELLIFNDADRVPALNFVESHVEAHRKSERLVVVGDVQEIYISNFTAKKGSVEQYFPKSRKPQYIKIMENIYDADGNSNSGLVWMTLYSGNASIRRTTLDRIRFDEKFVSWGLEHFDVGLRLYRSGIAFYYSAESKNYHIAHAREQGFYKNQLASSFSVFSSNHGDEVTAAFRDFYLGKMGLRELEAKIGREDADWLSRITGDFVFESLSELGE